ncbi:unnamed protein product [Caenorhabditis angaria]|uniref:Uncharacterized protein n=1 Tax=Caenorhabditis angaria TaxID=860376 RepID=A0A9P1N145_9PELO|nr:unnamed protein product [Caenorhabditis angaria]
MSDIKDVVSSKLNYHNSSQNRGILKEVVEIIFENAARNPEFIPQWIAICKTHTSDDLIAEFGDTSESYLRKIKQPEKRNIMSNADRNIIQLVGQLFINNLILWKILKKYIFELFESIQDPTKWSLANESNVQLGIVLIRNIGCVIDISENGPIHFWFGILEHVEPFLGNKTREMINDLLKLRKNGWNREKEIDEKNARIIELEQKIRGFQNDGLTEQHRKKHENNANEILSRKVEELEKKIERISKTNLNLENQVSGLQNELVAQQNVNSDIENLRQIIESNQAEIDPTNGSINVTITRFSHPEVNRIHQKYKGILKIDRKEFLSVIESRLATLCEMHPRRLDILQMKLDIMKFEDEKLADYLREVNEKYWKIEWNHNISIEELGEEIEEFPSIDFMEKYNRLIAENNLTNNHLSLS